jgi:AraC-like DNA-binding protein
MTVIPFEPALESAASGSWKRRRIAQQVREYVDVHFRSGISLRDVARALGYTPAHLTYLFRCATGTPITAFIIERRLREACVLLESSDATVAHVAESVGFRDVAYFSRQFQRFTGMTPGRWRHLERENALAQSRCPACAGPVLVPAKGGAGTYSVTVTGATLAGTPVSYEGTVKIT